MQDAKPVNNIEKSLVKKDFYAPVSGKTIDLTAIPDEVFANLMVGNGISIEPETEQLLAPCDGEIINIHPSHHALSIRTDDGYEVLMHIGLDTVSLRGEGFTLLTELGKNVVKGEPLISFNLATITQKAKISLIEVIVTKGDANLLFNQNIGAKVEAGKDIIMDVWEDVSATNKKMEQEKLSSQASNSIESWNVTINAKDGLHARPAAKIANEAKKYASEINLVTEDGRKANAKSVTSLMSLNIKTGDKVHLEAQGNDNEDALYYLTPLLDAKEDIALSEEPEETKLSDALTNEKAFINDSQEKDKLTAKANNVSSFQGTPASSGIAIGFTRVLEKERGGFIEDSENPKEEVNKLTEAIKKATIELDKLYQNTKLNSYAKQDGDIFLAHKELLNDPVLTDRAFEIINRGKTAAYAWDKTTNEEADRLAGLENQLLAERAADLRDIGSRVLNILAPLDTNNNVHLEANTILLAKELTPSDTAGLDKEKIIGIATVIGSATSHFAILARSFGIPAITGLPPEILEIKNNTEAILNGDTGFIQLSPSKEEVLKARKESEAINANYSSLLAESKSIATTKDGKIIEVAGNIGSIEEAELVMKNGGDGVGLLRSEFLFMNRDTAPTEDELAETYVKIAKILGKGKRFIVRTLDAGGDKPLPYLQYEHEDNPFLGIRGIRLSLANKDLFKAQIRAILRAAPFCDLHIMFPMISSVEEFIEAKDIVLQEKENLKIEENVKIGLMIEVPSAVLIAESFAREADFFSIGTNDLTQYTLAMDRSNPRLNKIADGLHPALLRLIKMTIEKAHKYNRFVGVCGGLASEETAVPLLLGLGVDELSVAPPSIPIIKGRVRSTDTNNADKLSAKLLELSSASEIRNELALDSKSKK